MSGSVSPLPWTGNKGCIYTTIDAFMPPHRTYVEACMGSAEVFLRKKPVEKEIINDYNGDLVRFFRVLQRNENLERLIGRLFLSFNSEQIFRANKALLAEVPNILDDLTETSVIIENTQWNDFDLAVAFYENQVFSFSSTGKNFAITKKDMTKRFGRLIAAFAKGDEPAELQRGRHHQERPEALGKKQKILETEGTPCRALPQECGQPKVCHLRASQPSEASR